MCNSSGFSVSLCIAFKFFFATLQTPSIASLDDFLKEQPDKKDMIMSNLKGTLLPLIDKYVKIGGRG